MGNREGSETERLLLCDSSEITLAVIKIGLKTKAKKRENTQPLPSLFIYSQF